MSFPASPVYCNKVDELIPFDSQQAAEQWLKNNSLNTSGTPILVPFKDENGQIWFLKPDDSADNLRITGEANEHHTHGIINRIKEQLGSNRVPHLNELDRDTISLVEHGFIIIYAKGEKKVGRKIVQFLNQEKPGLINRIKEAKTNEDPHSYINDAEFLEKLATLASDLDIKGGMAYFVTQDNKGHQHVYRQLFKQDPENKNLVTYLIKEQERHKAEHVTVYNHKSKNYHILGFLKDWCKWTVFSALTAIGAGLLIGLFMAAPLGTIIAPLIAVATFIGFSSYGFHKAHNDNPTTIEFGEPQFKTESKKSDTLFAWISCRLLPIFPQESNSITSFFKSAAKLESTTQTGDQPERKTPALSR